MTPLSPVAVRVVTAYFYYIFRNVRNIDYRVTVSRAGVRCAVSVACDRRGLFAFPVSRATHRRPRSPRGGRLFLV